LSDTDWWWQNDGLTVGYLGYGMGSCGAWSQASRAWQPYTVWWTGDSINPWSPAGPPGRVSNQSGWCNNYGRGNRFRYALWVNRILLPTTKHRRTWNRKSTGNSNGGIRATAEQVPRELNADRAGPDDDWTRVADHIEYTHPRQTAALAHQRAREIRGLLRGARSQNPQRAHVEKMRGLERRDVVQTKVFAPPHISVARPTAHIAARSGGRGHS
jgi:hypothetical protein